MAKQKTMVNDLTEGSVVRQLFLFALPLFASNALQAIYNIVDMVVVGNVIGGHGMSAVSIGGDVLHLLTFVAMGFSSAGQVIISQYVGARKYDQIRKMIGTMFTFLLSVSIIISLIFFVLRTPILGWLNTPAESYDYTMDYVVTCIVGLIFIYGYNIVSAILRGMGDSRRPFVFIGIAAVLNTILDIVFVQFCGMEVFGAALATVIGQGVSFGISIVYLYRHKESFGFDFKRSSFAIDKQSLKPLVRLGIPMAIQSAAVSLSKIVLMARINAAGVVYSAISGIYNKLNMVAGLVSNAFTTAGSSMVGQNLGAQRYERVTKILRMVLCVSLVVASLGTVAMLLIPDLIFSAFTTDAVVLASASLIIFPTIINLFGSATRSVAFALINGSGNSNLNLAVALIDGIVARVAFAALFGYSMQLGCQGFWFGDAVAGYMPILIGTIYLISGKWKTNRYLIKAGKQSDEKASENQPSDSKA